MTFRVKMLPGQVPYTEGELELLSALVADAAAGDPGEQDEREMVRLMDEASKVAKVRELALKLSVRISRTIVEVLGPEAVTDPEITRDVVTCAVSRSLAEGMVAVCADTGLDPRRVLSDVISELLAAGAIAPAGAAGDAKESN